MNQGGLIVSCSDSYNICMKRFHLSLSVFLFLAASGGAGAQAPLSVVEDIPLEPFQAHCRQLLETLDRVKAPLPADVDKALRALVGDEAADPAAAAQIQKLLDAHCLIAVSINPESRVKAARGPAPALLRLDQETIVLVKITNDGGVTHALTITGPQIRSESATDGGRWLEATVTTAPPARKALSGQKVEYVLLRLTAREAGKREATLRFDVGQGTQDLGFRAEVPVLFRVTKETVRP
jgi:hypothetical protein